MKIEELTIGQLKKALSTAQEEELNCDNTLAEVVTTHIVVLDRGFVYVGEPSWSEDKSFLTLLHARNIRIWGTSKGLGELVNGPLSKTVLDEAGQIVIPRRAIIHLIVCKKNW